MPEPRRTATSNGATTIHILEAGKTLCGFENGKPPKDWPDFHVWVAIDRSIGANCVRCLARLESQMRTS